jgi:hypothetical protein
MKGTLMTNSDFNKSALSADLKANIKNYQKMMQIDDFDEAFEKYFSDEILCREEPSHGDELVARNRYDRNHYTFDGYDSENSSKIWVRINGGDYQNRYKYAFCEFIEADRAKRQEVKKEDPSFGDDLTL